MKPRVRVHLRSWAPRRPRCRPALQPLLTVRHAHHDSRRRTSDFWTPTVSVQSLDAPAAGAADTTQLLVRAGYLRQAYAGIFHMLPLGLRVQEKLERLIDKHMRSVKASKVSLSSITSPTLWHQSGRFNTGSEEYKRRSHIHKVDGEVFKKESEMFMFRDRKNTGWLLAPTHEEEITNLLVPIILTAGQLPVRLYQIGRKYRDEKRPRGGLLRGREFLMKDLYTFDSSPEQAHLTYEEIRTAYRNFLDELKVKYLEVRATSGNMGGNLSHEFHFPSPAGEDTVITCSHCDYSRNQEFVSQHKFTLESFKTAQDLVPADEDNMKEYVYEDFITTDLLTLVRVITASEHGSSSQRVRGMINPHAVKSVLGHLSVEIDTGVENPLQRFLQKNESSPGEIKYGRSVYFLLDSNVPPGIVPRAAVSRFEGGWASFHLVQALQTDPKRASTLSKHRTGDSCPQCETGSLKVDTAIEVGHTFHLGTRYSSKLGLTIRREGQMGGVAVEMGCHGIGVTRLIAATAACLSDETGLNWPRVMAPFEALIAVDISQAGKLQAAEKLYDQLSDASRGDGIDVILDDRDQGVGYKLKDADMIGYPVIVVVGKAFDQGKVEVQCRQLEIKEAVDTGAVPEFVRKLLQHL